MATDLAVVVVGDGRFMGVALVIIALFFKLIRLRAIICTDTLKGGKEIFRNSYPFLFHIYIYILDLFLIESCNYN